MEGEVLDLEGSAVIREANGRTHPLTIQLTHNRLDIDTIGKLSPSNAMERLLRRRLSQSDVLESIRLAKQLLKCQ